MKTLLKKVYYCDHCKKKYSISAGALSRHEKGCNQNPNNWHKCFDYCVHLKKENELIEHDEMPYRITNFTCTLLNKKMYSYKLERKVGCFSMYTSNLERMPLECEHYEHDSKSLF